MEERTTSTVLVLSYDEHIQQVLWCVLLIYEWRTSLLLYCHLEQ